MGPAGPRTGRGAGLFILGGNQYFVACYDTFIGNYGRGAGIEAGGGKRAGSDPPCFDPPAFPSSAALRVTPVPIPSGLRPFPDPLCLAMLDISLPLLSLRDISLSPLSRYARHLPLIRGVGPLTGGIGPVIRGAGPRGKAWRDAVEKPHLGRLLGKALDGGHETHGGAPEKNAFET